MTKEEKAYYVNTILEELCQQATLQKKQFNVGDTFFRLAFMNDSNLLKMAKAMKISPPKT